MLDCWDDVGQGKLDERLKCHRYPRLVVGFEVLIRNQIISHKGESQKDQTGLSDRVHEHQVKLVIWIHDHCAEQITCKSPINQTLQHQNSWRRPIRRSLSVAPASARLIAAGNAKSTDRAVGSIVLAVMQYSNKINDWQHFAYTPPSSSEHICSTTRSNQPTDDKDCRRASRFRTRSTWAKSDASASWSDLASSTF